MQQFRISESAYKKIRKRLLIWSPIGIIIGCAIGTNGRLDTHSLYYLIPYMVVIAALSYFSVFRRQKKMIQTYVVTISDDGITREQAGTPPLTISFMEIKEIVRTKRSAFIIRGLQRKDIIVIPRWIEDRDVLEDRLAELAPISTKSQDPVYKHYRNFLGLGAFAMYLCVAFVTNKIAVIIAGILAIGLYIWAFIEISTNTNLPAGTRKRSYLYFLFIILVLSTMYTKLAKFGF